MASLCAKNFRVYRLLTDSTMKIIKITNFHLLLIVTIVLIPFVAYMLIWTLVDGEQALIVPSRYYCSSNSFLWRVFLGVLAVRANLLACKPFYASNYGAFFSSLLFVGVLACCWYHLGHPHKKHSPALPRVLYAWNGRS
jgi:hypothetical protein